MKIKVKILVGISGSGKSTFSKNFVSERHGFKRINRDDLREMLDSYKLTDGNENFARIARNKMIELCLSFDRHIIIDDTNCIEEKLIELIQYIKIIADNLMKEVEIEVIDFDTDFEVCLERNRNREKPVDEKFLYYMKKNKDFIKSETLPIDNYTIIKD